MKKFIIILMMCLPCFAETFEEYNAYYPKTCKIQNARMNYGYGAGVYQLNCIEKGELKTYGTVYAKMLGKKPFVVNHIPSATKHLYLEKK